MLQFQSEQKSPKKVWGGKQPDPPPTLQVHPRSNCPDGGQVLEGSTPTSLSPAIQMGETAGLYQEVLAFTGAFWPRSSWESPTLKQPGIARQTCPFGQALPEWPEATLSLVQMAHLITPRHKHFSVTAV